MQLLENMVWQVWPQKSSTKGFNFIPQMQNKFVERAFLIGGFVGSKSQAGSSPSRTQITLNDVIIEQLLQLRLNLYSDIISANCDSARKMIPAKVPFQNFNARNWKSNNLECNNYNYNWRSNMGSHCINSTSSYFSQFSGGKPSESRNTKTLSEVPPPQKHSQNVYDVPLTKHSQEELVYEDKDEGGNSIYVYQEVQKSTCEVTKTSVIHVRSRTISDCSIESDDSFIIFESNDENGEDNVVLSEDDEDEEEEEEDDEADADVLENCEYEDSSSEESIECAEIDHLLLECQFLEFTPSRITEANQKWNKVYGCVSDLQKSPQKVSFASGKQLANVKTMVTWNYAHRAARKGPWETLALDTTRFKTKIEQLSYIINPILDENHRKRIFQQRFQTPSHKNK